MYQLDNKELAPVTKKSKFKSNLIPALTLLLCLTGFVFSFFIPIIGLIICIIGFIFSIAIKSGDYRLDKFGVLFSILGFLISIIVGAIQLFVASIPVLLPVLKVLGVIAGLIKTITSLFGAGA